MILITLKFNEIAIRAVVDEFTNPWFFASDICNVLQIHNESAIIERLKDGEKRLINENGSIYGNALNVVVSESGLLSMIAISRKSSVRDFDKRSNLNDYQPMHNSRKLIKSGSLPTISQRPKVVFRDNLVNMQIAHLCSGLTEDYCVRDDNSSTCSIDSTSVISEQSLD